MHLKVLDQIMVSAVRPEQLRPGEVIEVGDALGADLMRARPTFFEDVSAHFPGDTEAAPAAEADVAVPRRKGKAAKA